MDFYPVKRLRACIEPPEFDALLLAWSELV